MAAPAHRSRRTRGRRAYPRAAITSDALARFVIHSAPQHFFQLLRWRPTPGPPYAAVRRLDTQAAPDLRLPDLVYVAGREDGVDAWVVELHRQSDRWRVDRATMAAELALTQSRTVYPTGPRVLRLVQARTLERARREGPEPDSRLLRAMSDDPCGVLRWSASNRLVVEGPWTEVLRSEPTAWPLLGLCTFVTADELASRYVALRRLREQCGPNIPLDRTYGLLGVVGRARFPEDERFREEEAMKMIDAAGAAEPWGELRRSEIDNHVQRARTEHRQQMAAAAAAGRAAGLAEGRTAGLAEGRTAGLAEGRTAGLAEGRAALLRLVQTLAPERVPAMASIPDLATLTEEVSALMQAQRR